MIISRLTVEASSKVGGEGGCQGRGGGSMSDHKPFDSGVRWLAAIVKCVRAPIACACMSVRHLHRLFGFCLPPDMTDIIPSRKNGNINFHTFSLKGHFPGIFRCKHKNRLPEKWMWRFSIQLSLHGGIERDTLYSVWSCFVKCKGVRFPSSNNKHHAATVSLQQTTSQPDFVRRRALPRFVSFGA